MSSTAAARAAAFFDMDHTLLHCNTGSRWIAFLRARGEIRIGMLLRSLSYLVQYRLAILDMETAASRMVAAMAGESEAELIRKTQEFMQLEVLPAVAPLGVAAIAEHRAQQHAVVLLTSATPYVAEPLSAHLGLEHVLCTRLHVEDGRFLGTCVRPTCYGVGKVHHAERFAAEHGIDLASSYFYSDSYSDLPMLERVGQPRVINPDVRLGRLARQRGWSVAQW